MMILSQLKLGPNPLPDLSTGSVQLALVFPPDVNLQRAALQVVLLLLACNKPVLQMTCVNPHKMQAA